MEVLYAQIRIKAGRVACVLLVELRRSKSQMVGHAKLDEQVRRAYDLQTEFYNVRRERELYRKRI